MRVSDIDSNRQNACRTLNRSGDVGRQFKAGQIAGIEPYGIAGIAAGNGLTGKPASAKACDDIMHRRLAPDDVIDADKLFKPRRNACLLAQFAQRRSLDRLAEFHMAARQGPEMRRLGAPDQQNPAFPPDAGRSAKARQLLRRGSRSILGHVQPLQFPQVGGRD